MPSATIDLATAARVHADFVNAEGSTVSGPDVSWSIDDETVAVVGDHNGVETLVNPVSVGTAVLTGTAEGVAPATFEVTVIEVSGPGGPELSLSLRFVGSEPLA